jgi:hypothetical protein
MSKLTTALLLVVFAVSVPRNCAATNYHEYKKFEPPVSTERVPSKCHASLKERRNYYYCDKWRDFLHND